jgi:hypothetical protein
VDADGVPPRARYSAAAGRPLAPPLTCSHAERDHPEPQRRIYTNHQRPNRRRSGAPDETNCNWLVQMYRDTPNMPRSQLQFVARKT